MLHRRKRLTAASLAALAVTMLFSATGPTTAAAAAPVPTKATASQAAPSTSADLPLGQGVDKITKVFLDAGYTRAEIAYIKAHHLEAAIGVSTTASLDVTNPAEMKLNWVPVKQTTDPTVMTPMATTTLKFDVSRACTTVAHTVNRRNYLGSVLMSFTVTDYICWYRYHTTYCPCLYWVYSYSQGWTWDQITQQVRQNVTSWGAAAGWHWLGFADTGNIPPVPLTYGNAIMRRTGKFGADFTLANAGPRFCWYPYVEWEQYFPSGVISGVSGATT